MVGLTLNAIGRFEKQRCEGRGGKKRGCLGVAKWLDGERGAAAR